MEKNLITALNVRINYFLRYKIFANSVFLMGITSMENYVLYVILPAKNVPAIKLIAV